MKLKDIQFWIQRIIGVNARLYKLEDSVRTLHYFLNTYCVDVNNVGPTQDEELRILQKCDSMLLLIIAKVCEKNNLDYWLDYGTLLGGVRHKGFIPWDDDVDISMTRESYLRFVDVFNKEISSKDFSIEYQENEPLRNLGVGYKHSQTGIWCDIFPTDIYLARGTFDEALQTYKEKEKIWIKQYHKKKKKLSTLELYSLKESVFSDNEKDNTNVCKIVTPGREFPHVHPNAYFRYDEVFPLTKVEFEGQQLNAPINPELYLCKCIAPSWNQLPLRGALHHGGDHTTRPELKKWAKQNDIDMNKEYENLLNIYNSL